MATSLHFIHLCWIQYFITFCRNGGRKRNENKKTGGNRTKSRSFVGSRKKKSDKLLNNKNAYPQPFKIMRLLLGCFGMGFGRVLGGPKPLMTTAFASIGLEARRGRHGAGKLEADRVRGCVARSHFQLLRQVFLLQKALGWRGYDVAFL